MNNVKYILNASFYYLLGAFIAVCIFGLINLLIEFLKLYIK